MALTDQKITALYERLSRDDDLVGDSNSILTQKLMLENYAASHGFMNCVHYTDDGWSGGNFDRPSWKQLMADVEAGKIGCVIVKDMSRVGRDYLQTGFYTEVVFRQHGVRFIAISNGVDSADAATGEFAPFLNIMNEWFLRDCSRKQIAAYQVRGKAGIPTTNVAIYGYKKDPEDKHHWLIDEEAAAVVRKIFQLAIDGHGPYEIASILRDSKIERPGSYLGRHYCDPARNSADKDRCYDWSGTTVSSILSKPEYMGHTVNFRTHKESYKDKKSKSIPPEDWLIFKNTHEAIVDEETWELAQKTRSVVHRTDSTGEANPLTGLMICADCGARMYNHRGYARAVREGRAWDPEAGVLPYDRYECSSYNKSTYRMERSCCTHNISTTAVRSLILDTIRMTSEYALSNKEEFDRRVREASELRQNEAAKDLKRRIARAQKRSAELDTLIKKLYESYALEKISESRFETLIAEYEKEQAELKVVIAAGQNDLDEFNSDTNRIEQFMELAKRYTDFTTLTTPMIYEFVDKIVVHAPCKDEHGERCQEIEIYLKYIGKLDLPVKEPTAEELAAEEKKRKRRAYSREYNRRRYAEKKAAVLAAVQAVAGTKGTHDPDQSPPDEKDAVNHRPLPDEKTA